MSSLNLVKNRKILTSTAIISIAIIFLLAFSPATTLGVASASSQSNLASSGWGHTIVVKPNGHNDTQDIQKALNECATDGPHCTVQLVKGTYYIDQITVYGFQGSFVGWGQGVTVIQALPNMSSPAPQCNTNTTPFWACLPGPSNPWPDMFTFVNGTFSIYGMTITEPYTNPTKGWDDEVEGNGNVTALLAAITITGEKASVTIDHLTVIGTTGDWDGFNMVGAIYYIGLLLPEGWTNPLSQRIPLTGTFSLTNSLIIENNPVIENVLNAVVTISHNTVEDNPAVVYADDVSNSTLTITGNKGIDIFSFAAVVLYQSVWIPGLLPSTVYITGNYFQVSEGANAVYLQDFGEANFGTPSTLSALVSGNVFYTNTSCECYNGSEPYYYSVVLSLSLKSVAISRNTILDGGSAGVYVVGGPGVVSRNAISGSYAGVWVDYANGVNVTSNAIKNSATWGIAVTHDSNSTLVGWNYVKNSGQYDLYWDGTGTGNVWTNNYCQTSYPSGLCK